jgi:hypothetical protein
MVELDAFSCSASTLYKFGGTNMRITLIISTLLLTGCIADQRTDNQGGNARTDGPIINLPAPQTVDTEKLEKNMTDKIIASSNTTQNQLSGLLTTSISKVAEKVTGLETNLSELIKLNTTINNTAQAEIKTKLDSAITLNTELKAEMKNIIEVNNKMEAELKILTEIRVEIGKFNTQAQGQVGWNNKLENKIEDLKQTFTSTAGRDVNMLPQQAVDVIINSWKLFAAIIATIMTAATTILSMSYHYARIRAEEAFKLEHQERQNTHKLLLIALAHCPADKADEIKRNLII